MQQHLRITSLSTLLITYAIEVRIFWDVKSSRPLKVNRRFGAAYRLHFQGQRQAKHETRETQVL
jgi:hypothetical protein